MVVFVCSFSFSFLFFVLKVRYWYLTHLSITLWPVYFRELVLKGLQVLIYSGDVDAILPSAGTRFWINALGFEKRGPWRHWTVEGQVKIFRIVCVLYIILGVFAHLPKMLNHRLPVSSKNMNAVLRLQQV